MLKLVHICKSRRKNWSGLLFSRSTV